MIEKKMLRRDIRARLSSISYDKKVECSKNLCKVLESRILECGAKVVALFSPLSDEPQIFSLVERLSQKMTVVLPRVEGDTMQFYCYSCENMVSGSFGIMEPVGEEAVAPCSIDVIVVPGVAFTMKGERLGRGKGFYDKYMSASGFRAIKIGVCYTEQVCDCLPVEPHDLRMDSVVHS